jgi:hypothetical protein
MRQRAGLSLRGVDAQVWKRPRSPQRHSYRLAHDKWAHLPRETLTALCDAPEVEPGELFAFAPEKRRKAG